MRYTAAKSRYAPVWSPKVPPSLGDPCPTKFVILERQSRSVRPFCGLLAVVTNRETDEHTLIHRQTTVTALHL